MKAIYRKQFLPNYGVFDEDRYFQPGRGLVLLRCGETLVGPTVCEDIWQPGPPATDLALAGAHVVANISASPFHLGKGAEREEMLATRARDNACWIAFVNAVGAQDELIFDGHSLVLDENGDVVARGPAFEEALVLVDVDATTAVARRLRDARRRALARSRRDLQDPLVVDVPLARSRAAPRGGAGRRAAPGRARGDAAGDRARPARLRTEERLHGRRARDSPAASTRR